MRILITNHRLKKLGGTETFTYTMVKAAKELGHDVDLFTFHPGIVSDKIRQDFGIKNTIRDSYDLVLANHHTTVEAIYNRKVGPIIQTCHGITPKLERLSGFADVYVAISKEIQEYYTGKILKPIPVILNSIDTNRFKDKTELAPTVTSVLSLSHSDKLNSQLYRIFTELGIHFESLNKYVNPSWNVESAILRSDLVISLGRGAYEALSCGRPVLVLDHRPYQEMISDGMILPDNIESLVQTNFSGRYCRLKVNPDPFIRLQLMNYNSMNQFYYRSWAVQNLNYITNFQKYLALCKTL